MTAPTGPQTTTRLMFQVEESYNGGFWRPIGKPFTHRPMAEALVAGYRIKAARRVQGEDIEFRIVEVQL